MTRRRGSGYRMCQSMSGRARCRHTPKHRNGRNRRTRPAPSSRRSSMHPARRHSARRTTELSGGCGGSPLPTAAGAGSSARPEGDNSWRNLSSRSGVVGLRHLNPCVPFPPGVLARVRWPGAPPTAGTPRPFDDRRQPLLPPALLPQTDRQVVNDLARSWMPVYAFTPLFHSTANILGPLLVGAAVTCRVGRRCAASSR